MALTLQYCWDGKWYNYPTHSIKAMGLNTEQDMHDWVARSKRERVADDSTEGEAAPEDVVASERELRNKYGDGPGQRDLSKCNFRPEAVAAVIKALRGE